MSHLLAYRRKRLAVSLELCRKEKGLSFGAPMVEDESGDSARVLGDLSGVLTN